MTENEISKILVNIFLKVHRTLGSGLLESAYEEATCMNLISLDLSIKGNKEFKSFMKV